MLMFTLVFGSLAFTLVVLIASSYALFQNHLANIRYEQERSFQIAEAGINYYRWHLAHNKEDFQDGTGQPGPYIHDFYDKDNNFIGNFSLEIEPPTNYSTIVKIHSTGISNNKPKQKRKILVSFGFPSLTDYVFLTNEDIWIGDNEKTLGKIHANGGIRFDGQGNAQISSARPNYICQPYHGCWYELKPGVWGDGEPQDLWSFPKPAKDFEAITVNLAQIKEQALDDGIYLSSSGRQGWHLTFTANGQIEIRKVLSTYCYRAQCIDDNWFHWYCLDIRRQASPVVYNMPNNTFIYVEDNVWVDGQVNGRVTLGVAENRSIIIDDNLVYTNKDVNHSLGLIAEQNVFVSRNSPNVLEINAVLLAQHGSVQRCYYSGNVKDTLKFYGSIISHGIWTWTWTNGWGGVSSGYINTESAYDVNLLFNPPGGFPVANDYKLISWQEELN